jgi:hypothetical protein
MARQTSLCRSSMRPAWTPSPWKMNGQRRRWPALPSMFHIDFETQPCNASLGKSPILTSGSAASPLPLLLEPAIHCRCYTVSLRARISATLMRASHHRSPSSKLDLASMCRHPHLQKLRHSRLALWPPRPHLSSLLARLQHPNHLGRRTLKHSSTLSLHHCRPTRCICDKLILTKPKWLLKQRWISMALGWAL